MSGANDFPCLDRPLNHAEERMQDRIFNCQKVQISGLGAFPQLGQEVLPFIINLSTGDRDWLDWFKCRNFCPIEPETTLIRFRKDDVKIDVDGGKWIRAGLKADQLGMMAISCRIALQNLLGQQGLAP